MTGGSLTAGVPPAIDGVDIHFLAQALPIGLSKKGQSRASNKLEGVEFANPSVFLNGWPLKIHAKTESSSTLASRPDRTSAFFMCTPADSTAIGHETARTAL